MKQIYIDSFQIHDYILKNGFYVSPEIEGLEYPDIRQESYDSPGQKGGFVSNNLEGGRMFTIEGFVDADTITLYEQRRTAFLDAFALTTDDYGLPVSKVFRFITMDDFDLEMEVYPKKIRFPRKYLKAGRYSIDLFAPNYVIRSHALSSVNLSRSSGGGVTYPVIYPVIYGAETGGSVIITNVGNSPSFPLIYLNGPLTNPVLLNQTLGRFVELDLTIASGEQVILDMSKPSIMKGTLSVVSYKSDSSKYWWLAKGANLIKLLTSSTGDTGVAQIQWQPTWAGK